MTETTAVKVPDFVARMLQEESELADKYEKISAVVDPKVMMDMPAGMTPAEHKETMYLLVRQHEYMKGYLYVLRQRIRNLSVQFGFEFKK